MVEAGEDGEAADIGEAQDDDRRYAGHDIAALPHQSLLTTMYSTILDALYCGLGMRIQRTVCARGISGPLTVAEGRQGVSDYVMNLWKFKDLRLRLQTPLR